MEGHGLVPRAPGAVDLRGADTPYTKRSMQLQSQNSLPTSSMSLPQSLLERGAHKALAVQQDATQQGPVVTSLNPAYATCTRSGVDGQLCVEVRQGISGQRCLTSTCCSYLPAQLHASTVRAPR